VIQSPCDDTARANSTGADGEAADIPRGGERGESGDGIHPGTATAARNVAGVSQGRGGGVSQLAKKVAAAEREKHEAEFALILRARPHNFREVDDEFLLDGRAFKREYRFGREFAAKYWKKESPGFVADFAVMRRDGRMLVIEIQGGIWRRGGGAHRGVGAVRDGVKSCAALFEDLDFLAVTPEQIKNGAALAAVMAWFNRGRRTGN